MTAKNYQAGQRDANQRVTLDGVIASDPLVNTVYLNPSIDAIEEIKIQTGSYSAEYGMNNGANVQVALKSGSNDFHGSLFESCETESSTHETHLRQRGMD